MIIGASTGSIILSTSDSIGHIDCSLIFDDIDMNFDGIDSFNHQSDLYDNCMSNKENMKLLLYFVFPLVTSMIVMLVSTLTRTSTKYEREGSIF